MCTIYWVRGTGFDNTITNVGYIMEFLVHKIQQFHFTAVDF